MTIFPIWFQVLEYLLDMHEVIINGCDTLNGDTALTAAASAGQNGSCLVLIRRGASLLVSDLKESFPLHMATRQGHWGVADTLLKEGADPNLLDGGQRSSLMIAALEAIWDSVNFSFHAVPDLTLKTGMVSLVKTASFFVEKMRNIAHSLKNTGH